MQVSCAGFCRSGRRLSLVQRLPTSLALCFGPFATLPANQLVHELAENPHTSASRLGRRDSAAASQTPGSKTLVPGSKTLDPGTPASKPGQATGGVEEAGAARTSWFSKIRAGASALQGSARARRGGSVKPVGSGSPDSPPGGWPDLELGSLGAAQNGAARAKRRVLEFPGLEQGASTATPTPFSGATRQTGAMPRAAAGDGAVSPWPASDGADGCAQTSDGLAEPSGVLRVAEDGSVEARRESFGTAGEARLQCSLILHLVVCMLSSREQLSCMQSRLVNRGPRVSIDQGSSPLLHCVHGGVVSQSHDIGSAAHN